MLVEEQHRDFTQKTGEAREHGLTGRWPCYTKRPSVRFSEGFGHWPALPQGSLKNFAIGVSCAHRLTEFACYNTKPLYKFSRCLTVRDPCMSRVNARVIKEFNGSSYTEALEMSSSLVSCSIRSTVVTNGVLVSPSPDDGAIGYRIWRVSRSCRVVHDSTRLIFERIHPVGQARNIESECVSLCKISRVFERRLSFRPASTSIASTHTLRYLML